MSGPHVSGIQLLGGNHLTVKGIEVNDIVPGMVQTIIGDLSLGIGIWAHESILATSDAPRFHGSRAICRLITESG